ncbi:MAG: TolC family protein [Planctomycetota bacterium]|nr:TolC family protein [Planctomycetota bacterium]
MPHRPLENHPARVLGPVLLCVLLGGCRSPEEYRAEADEQVYEIIRTRRDQLAAGGGFTIDPPADSLRTRILSEEALDETGALPPLTLLQCLEIAAENSREYRSRRENLFLAALDLTLEHWRFSVQETGTVAGSVSGTGRTAEDATVSGNLGLSKLLGTGALIVGDIGVDLFRVLSTGDGWDAVSLANITITQPLLRGFGRRIVEEPLTQAERDVLYEVRSYERFRRTFAFDVSERVFRILQAVDTLGNERRNEESLAELRERNQAEAEAGRLSDIEVDQVIQDELRARNRVVIAQRDLEAQLDAFKLFLGLPVETSLSIVQEDMDQVLAVLELPEVDFDEALASRVALRERLDHQTVMDQVDDAERRVYVAEDALRMGLDLRVDGSVTSDEGQPLDVSGSNTPWSGSLSLDLPIDRLPERNAYRAALIRREAALRAHEQSTDDVIADVRDALRRLEAARETLSIQENTTALNERRIESANLNKEAGRADTRDVLEAQEDLLEAQNNLIQARIDYTLAGLALYRDMELLRVDDGGLSVELGPLIEEEIEEEVEE